MHDIWIRKIDRVEGVTLHDRFTSNLGCHVRNLFIFQGITWMAYEIVKVSFSWAQQYELSLYGDQCTSHFSGSHATLEGTWMHLFIDGAMARDYGNVLTGGVLRDQYGN
ncbi:hypothetical protein PVK06_009079 [Gossypium arboreum]|uniref:Uncharacterized protein n=1 Tax=Gossypium arboreum TaxID=29729 RepID=A0ABR0QLP3_GOSAR|nr:hypothetical protein PVK06_009079 [Gossypium arboreum]